MSPSLLPLSVKTSARALISAVKDDQNVLATYLLVSRTAASLGLAGLAIALSPSGGDVLLSSGSEAALDPVRDLSRPSSDENVSTSFSSLNMRSRSSASPVFPPVFARGLRVLALH